MKLMISLFLICSVALAKVKVQDVTLDKDAQGNAVFKIRYSGEMTSDPVLSFGTDMIQIVLDNAIVWPKITKRATLNRSFDTEMMAYQFDKDTVRIRAMLPFKSAQIAKGTAVSLRGDSIEIDFKMPADLAAHSQPIQPQIVKRAPRVVIKKEEAKTNEKLNQLDEAYLEKLLNNKKNVNVDEVKTQLSANEKSPKSHTQTMTAYALKFAGFLAVVIMLFFGLVHLFKKGVTKKGKLGFLSSNEIVEVLSTTYMGPKRSLVLVRAHQQIFLLSSTESQISLISEVNDLPGLLKGAEKTVSGKNFDSTYEDIGPITQKLKENPFEGREKLDQKDKSRFSDQVKSKLKNLKSLQ